MIKPEELRVGNRYMSTKFQVRVTCEMSDFAHIEDIADGARPNKDHVAAVFQPLTLTEEWLIRGGFKKTGKEFGINNNYSFNEWKNGCIELSPNGSEWICDGLDQMGAEPYVKYVHQLQNLYYALCQTELVFSAPKNAEK